jgi:signal transduction histidine kinase
MSCSNRLADADPALACQLEAARQEVAQARSCFDTFADLAPFACLCLDAQGLISQANRMAGIMFDLPLDDLVGTRFARYVAASHEQVWRDHVEQAAGTGQRRQVELQLDQVAGRMLDLLVDSTTSVGPGGVSTHYLVLTDISARRLAGHDRRIAENAVFGRESERRRIALALHEDLGQLLTALKMALSPATPDGDIHIARPRSGQTLALLDRAMATVWRLATELRPLMLDDLGLGAAVDWLARDSGRRLALKVNVQVPEQEPALSEQAALGAYRVAQLALEQVVRQAHMHEVSVAIHESAGELVLGISGRGDKPGEIAGGDRPASEPGLEDWVHLLGGQLRSGETSTGQQQLTIVLPLHPGSQAEPAPA